MFYTKLFFTLLFCSSWIPHLVPLIPEAKLVVFFTSLIALVKLFDCMTVELTDIIQKKSTSSDFMNTIIAEVARIGVSSLFAEKNYPSRKSN